jgi:CelD/BcsL family acetyltransferase involved in cellulose biosynthesis
LLKQIPPTGSTIGQRPAFGVEDSSNPRTIEVSEITDLALLEQMRDDWSELVAACGNPSPYITPEFLIPWMRSLDQGWECRVLVARQGKRTVGLAPLFDRLIRRFAISCVIRSFPLRGTTPPFDIIVGEPADDIVRAILQYLCRSGGWDILWLHGISHSSATLPYIGVIASEFNLSCHIEISEHSLMVPIRGSWDAFLASHSKKFRQNIRRAWRALEQLGTPRIITYPGSSLTVSVATGFILDVIQRSWKGYQGENDVHGQTILECAREFDRRNWLSLRFLMLDETPIAYLFVIEYRNNAFAYHTAYDLEYQRASPGLFLIQDAVCCAFEKGLGVFDFGGSTDFLKRWTDYEQPITEFRFAKASFTSRIKRSIYFRIRERRHRAALSEVDRKKESGKDALRAAHRPRR